MRLANKVALVTGGGSGIGEAACRAFAREGAAVGVLDFRREPAEAVAQGIRDAGGRAVALEADVQRMVDETAVTETEQLSVFVGPGFVVTFQERPGDCFEPVRQRLRDPNGQMQKRGSDYLAYALLRPERF